MKYQGKPVWVFPHNWREVLIETLEWKTDVLSSDHGAEQRIARRPLPRRSLEGAFLLSADSRSSFDTFIMSYGGSEMWVPIWHAAESLEAEVSQGDTAIRVQTSDTEFRKGGAIVLRDITTNVQEMATIRNVLVNSLELESSISSSWRAGTLVYPAELARLDGSVNAQALSSSVVDVSARFQLVQPTPITSKFHYPLYNGVPVLTLAPDEQENVLHTYERRMETIDNGVSSPFFLDTLGFGVTTQAYHWGVFGRGQRMALRRALHFLAGRRRAVWLPSFMKDLRIVRPINQGDRIIPISNVGYTETGVVDSLGRRDIYIRLRDGRDIFVKVESSYVVNGFMEVLELAEPSEFTILPNEVVCMSFMSLSRLDMDSVEIKHHTDSTGYATASSVWRSTPAIRSAEKWIPHGFGNTRKNGYPPFCKCDCSDLDTVNGIIFDGNLPGMYASHEDWGRFLADYTWYGSSGALNVGVVSGSAEAQAKIASFPLYTQEQAREILFNVPVFMQTPEEQVACAPDATQYSDIVCGGFGLPFPRPLQPALTHLRAAVARRPLSVVSSTQPSETGEPLDLSMFPYMPPTQDPSIIIEFCVEPQDVNQELWHREPDHTSQFRGAGSILDRVLGGYSIALTEQEQRAVAETGFRFQQMPTEVIIDKPTSISQVHGAVSPRISSGYDSFDRIRPRAGGIPASFAEYRESIQTANGGLLGDCNPQLNPIAGTFDPSFRESWVWALSGTFLSRLPAGPIVAVDLLLPNPERTLLSVLCFAETSPTAILATNILGEKERQLMFSTTLVHVISVQTRNRFWANPDLDTPFSFFPDTQTSYMIRVRNI